MHAANLPALHAQRSGRLIGARLTQQPDDGVARFAIEDHVDALINDRVWPRSTRQISQLRLTLRFEPQSGLSRVLGRSTLHLDMVDYPGEWLLDLPLLDQSFAQFSAEALVKARATGRERLADPFLRVLNDIDVEAPLDDRIANALAEAYTEYLRACRADETALSMLPPGRFLMPGDMEGSPALTFAPLEPPEDGAHLFNETLYRAFERRFEAYKRLVIKPFYIDHFARLDRQVVLVDTLAAINAGPEAMSDLQDALVAILKCFKPGKRNLISNIFGPRIDRIAFAATKADHLHHESHDRLEAILATLVGEATRKARFSGAQVQTLALASVRATREAKARKNGQMLKAVAGVPIAGETINGEQFDGEREVAIFPGDLPADPNALLRLGHDEQPLRFVRFRPPHLAAKNGEAPYLPHIRLDRLLEFLIGDKLN